jgi:desulfoferrodoxin (superoxide reductase-like protein)
MPVWGAPEATVKLDRRGFVLESLKWGSAVALLPACETPPPEYGPATGEFGSPYRREDAGPWEDKIEIHLPRVYGAMVDATRVRLWVEVQDTTEDPAKSHPMESDHYISQIVMQDNFLNIIDSREFAYDAEARMISTVELHPRVTTVEALAWCNEHGWWSAIYDTAQLAVDPGGDARRAYTRDSYGGYGDQVASHVPVFGRRPNGDYAVEIGTRADDELHPMDEGHYIERILIYDQYDQLRAQAALNAQYPEPIYTVSPNAIGGTDRIRVLAYCNNYDWWEAEYSVD